MCHIFMMQQMRSADHNYAVEAVREHIRIFATPPKEYGFDRGGWSEPHIAEIEELRAYPKIPVARKAMMAQAICRKAS